jgi:hypothetical protein
MPDNEVELSASSYHLSLMMPIPFSARTLRSSKSGAPPAGVGGSF